jgi:hypothetical protein
VDTVFSRRFYVLVFIPEVILCPNCVLPLLVSALGARVVPQRSGSRRDGPTLLDTPSGVPIFLLG